MDTRSEWRTFSNDEGGDDPSRVGAARNELLNGSQLDTLIASSDANSAAMAKLQGRSVAVKGERTLLNAYKDISSMCEAISLPRSIADIARHLFKRVDDSKALKGKSQESIIAACIFVACRQGQVPRTIKEIVTLTNVPKKEIGRSFKILERMLTAEGTSLNGNATAGTYVPTKSTSAAELMVRFCNRLALPPTIQVAAEELARRAQAQGTLAGRSPISIAASGIYLISHLMGKPKTPKEISDVAGVSDSTIRTAYKFLWISRDTLVDEKWYKGKGELASLIPKQ